MTRIPRRTPDQLKPAEHALYEQITGGPRARASSFPITDETGALNGPFNAMLLHPPLGDALQELGATIRYQGNLSDRAREIAILTVAAHWHSTFEQYAHERIALHIGLSEAEITALRNGIPPDVTDPSEVAISKATQHILDHHTLTDAEYAEAASILGPAKIFELTTLIGYYELLALQLRVFTVD